MPELPDQPAPAASPDATKPSDKPRKADKMTGQAPPPNEGQRPTDDTILRHLSGITMSRRWQVAMYKATDPDIGVRDFYFGVRKPAVDPATGDPIEEIDKNEILFKNEVGQTLGVLKAIYSKPEPVEAATDLFGRIQQLFTFPEKENQPRQLEREKRFEEFYTRLFSLTKLGLGTDDVPLDIASDALRTLRADVVRREGGIIKNNYMKKLGWPAMMAGLIFMALFLLYEKSPGAMAKLCQLPYYGAVFCSTKAADTLALFPSEAYELRHLFLLLAGCMLGTWASFAGRKVSLSFDDLAELEQDRLSPTMRLIFTGALTLILSLVFLTNMVQVSIGEFSTASLQTDGLAAFLVGAFFGLLEQSLPTAVMERARGFVEAVNAK